MMIALSMAEAAGSPLEKGGYVASALLVAHRMASLLKEITPDIKEWLKMRREAERIRFESVESQLEDLRLQSEHRLGCMTREQTLLNYAAAQTQLNKEQTELLKALVERFDSSPPSGLAT